MNQYYLAELAQKINRGLKESWTKGQTTGGKPVFGYDVVDKKCIINEYEANIIREAFTKYAQGYKAVAIVKMFKEKGYRRKNGMPIGENIYIAYSTISVTPALLNIKASFTIKSFRVLLRTKFGRQFVP